MTAVSVATSSAPPAFQPAADALAALRAELKGQFIERDPEIDAILLALIAEEHVLFLGPPGAAKSAVVNCVAKALDARYFPILLTKQTAPEEPFGPLDLPKLKEGIYRRVTTNRFPEAGIAMLDEIWKASSAILNTFLTALNEREFDNGGIRQPIPLKVCVGCANEVPSEDGLQAMYDRFLVRRWTPYIGERSNRRKLLLMSGEPKVEARLSDVELDTLRSYRRAVDYSGLVDQLLDIGETLLAAEIKVSDRRWRRVTKLIQASAILNGRQTVIPEDLLVIADALWDDPQDVNKVYGVVARSVSPDAEKALQLMDAATEIWKKAQSEATDLTKQGGIMALAELNRELKSVVSKMKALKQDRVVAERFAKVVEMHKAIADRVNKHVLGEKDDW